MTSRRFLIACILAAGTVSVTVSAQSGTRRESDTPKPSPVASPRLENPDVEKPRDLRDQVAGIDRRLRRTVGQTENQPTSIIRLGSERVQIFRDYTLPRGEQVRELVGVLGDMRVDGRVEGNVMLTAGDLTIGPDAYVGRSVAVFGGSLTIEKGAYVGNEILVFGGTATLPDGFVTRGEHVVMGTPEIGEALRGVYPWLTRGLLFGRLIVPDLEWTWMIAVLSFLIGFVLNLLFNRPVARCADALARRPMSAFFVGILALLVAPLLFTLVAATVVGLLVVPFAIAAFVAAGVIGKVGVSRALGRGVSPETDALDRGQAARSFTIGAVLITLCYLLPVFGLIVWGMVGIFGIGAATMTLSGRLRRERPAPAPFAPVDTAVAPPAPMPPAVAPSMTYAAAAPASFATPPIPAVSEPATFAGPELGVPAAGAAAAAAPAVTLPPGSDLSLYPRATFFDRIAAMAIDMMLVGIVMNLLIPRDFDSPPFVILVFLYHVAFWSWKGTTLGGIVCNTRIVRTTGQDPRFIDSLVRAMTGIFSVAALGIGILWMLNDAERQMWHDKIAGTVVVKLPRELVLV